MYTIIEVANTHGGSIKYLNSLIDEFKEFKENTGIKFQPFKYNEIALPDYEWYNVYQRLFFNEKEWYKIINKANKSKDVWLDLFDSYGIQIFKNNLDSIYGLKLQTSTLNNNTILNDLKKIDLSTKKIIINIAGREINEIEDYISFFENEIAPEELLIEVGFQGYPTELSDNGLSKIKPLKKRFKKRIVFADHLDSEHKYSKILPLVAFINGADVIEKHVMHSTLKTEYDYFSSINKDNFKKLHSFLIDFQPLLKQPFNNPKEIKYLNNTIQVPVLNQNKKAGDIISLKDLDFKRTDSTGLNYNQLTKKIDNGFIKLKIDKNKNELFQENDLLKTTTASIIAARLKSSRLKQKAKLKIGDLSSIETCIKNCLLFENIDYTILATSTEKEDDELKDFTYDKSVLFHKGHPKDVIQRYLDVIRIKNIDVFIRITGDMPYISKDIATILMKDHFRSGADYTVAKKAATGSNLEIINSSALEKIKQYFPYAKHSEYMTWYFQNNPEHFNLNFVDLPKNLIRDYRLTIDYQEDLDMMKSIELQFKKLDEEYSIIKLFNFLDNNPDIANINSHIGLKYKTDNELIQKLNKETKINESI